MDPYEIAYALNEISAQLRRIADTLDVTRQFGEAVIGTAELGETVNE